MTATQKIDSNALLHALGGFTGTEHYYRSLNPRVTYTDGVKWFADKAGAHWLLDIFATELVPFLKDPKGGDGFLSMKCRSHQPHDKSHHVADLLADDGNGNVLWTRHIEYTDCPEGTWSFFMGDGGPQETSVILLPSEY